MSGPAIARKRAVGQPIDPRHRPAVVEAQHEFRAHRDAAAIAADEPDDVRVPPAQRHEVDRPSPCRLSVSIVVSRISVFGR